MEKVATLRLRFVYNQKGRAKSSGRVLSTVKPPRDEVDLFVATIIDKIALQVSSATKRDFKQEILTKIIQAVREEMEHTVSQYASMIIGAPAASGGRGTLTTKADAVSDNTGRKVAMESASLSHMISPWQKRTREYLSRKRQSKPPGVGHENWWSYKGFMEKKLSDTKTWTKAMGGIRAQFQEHSSGSEKPSNRNRFIAQRTRSTTDRDARTRSDKQITYALGTIKVFVFEHLTTAMIPSLASETGSLNFRNIDGRQSGFTRLFDRFIDPSPRRNAKGQFASGRRSNLADRLGGRQRNYRPTMEPFLGFFLTRSVPIAVSNRVQKLVDASVRYKR